MKGFVASVLGLASLFSLPGAYTSPANPIAAFPSQPSIWTSTPTPTFFPSAPKSASRETLALQVNFPSRSAKAGSPGKVLGTSTSTLLPYVTQGELASQLQQLRLSLLGSLASTTAIPQNIAAGGNPDNPYAGLARISNLSNANLSGGTITNATLNGVMGLTDADIPPLSSLDGLLSISQGGTGTSTAPTANQLLLSDTNGNWEYVSTTSLGILSSGGASLLTANTWTALQNFSSGASTTLFSALGPAYFGATATSSFDGGGTLTLGGNLQLGATSISGNSIPTAGAILGSNNGSPNSFFLYTTARDNLMLGFNDGSGIFPNPTGNFNMLIGLHAAPYLTTGTENVLVGAGAGFWLTTGSYNVALGDNALGGIDSGATTTQGAIEQSIAVGYHAGASLQNGATGETIVGFYAGNDITTGNYNSLFGFQTGRYISTAAGTSAFGNQAMAGSASAPTTGAGNSVFGQYSGGSIQGAASNNSCFGSASCQYVTTGNYNSGFGSYALYGISGTPLTGSYNAAFGYQAGHKLQGTAQTNIVDQFGIFEAWSDEPWVVDGADVRVSLVCFGRVKQTEVLCDGKPTQRINADLTSGNLDLTTSRRLVENANVAVRGIERGGRFDVPGDQARDWLRAPSNPNGRTNADVLRPFALSRELVRRPADKWIIDFSGMTEADAALYELPYQHAVRHIKQARSTNRETRTSRQWWLFRRSGQLVKEAIDSLDRYLVTGLVWKHRLFTWLPKGVLPDTRLVVIARNDDTTFGILSSRFHTAWTLRICQYHGVGNDPVYTQGTTFETFPFPDGLTPNISAELYAGDGRAQDIATAARELHRLRSAWLNPPELVKTEPEILTKYPDRILPINTAAGTALRSRTLTNLYNEPPQWLLDAHAKLDCAVAHAYGWPEDISEADALAKLLEYNLARPSSAPMEADGDLDLGEE